VVDWPGCELAAGNRQLVRGGALPIAPGADPLSAFTEALES
jgi:hypothetical protein